jgi:hypothetical protein
LNIDIFDVKLEIAKFGFRVRYKLSNPLSFRGRIFSIIGK